jgi:hypothetical protein
MCYQNYLAISNTADVTSGKPIAVWSMSILDTLSYDKVIYIM